MTVLVWIAAIFLSSGRYQLDGDVAPIPLMGALGYDRLVTASMIILGDRYLRFVWPLLLGLFVVSSIILAVAATLE